MTDEVDGIGRSKFERAARAPFKGLARAYHRRGWGVFPVDAKKPAVAGVTGYGSK